MPSPLSPLVLQHPDEHRPERPVLFAVDQEFAEGPSPGVASVASDRVGPLEGGEAEDVEESARAAGGRASTRWRRAVSISSKVM
jgi:hypothetical protein